MKGWNVFPVSLFLPSFFFLLLPCFILFIHLPFSLSLSLHPVVLFFLSFFNTVNVKKMTYKRRRYITVVLLTRDKPTHIGRACIKSWGLKQRHRWKMVVEFTPFISATPWRWKRGGNMDPVSDSDVIIRECLCNFLCVWNKICIYNIMNYVIEYNYRGKIAENVDTTMNTTILWEKSIF